MGDLVKQDMDLIAPYRQSFAYDDTEKALQSLFIDVFNEIFADQIKDIHHYGMPHLGSPSVVERFSKQDGLAVLRRPGSSDLIMRVIYANWKSLGSKRGLAFLEFVLRMIWGDQWQIQRLYHSISRASVYPSLITTGPTRDSFLTSRIFITLGQNINVQEALEIAPVVAKLVPANMVARIASGLDLGEIQSMHVAVVGMRYMVANFQKFEPMSSLAIPWTPWGVLKKYVLTNDSVRYTGYKTNYQEMYHAPANYNLRGAALKAMAFSSYNGLYAVHEAIMALHPTAVASEPEAANKVVLASFLPEYKDEVAAGQVLLSRYMLSQGGAYMGDAFMPSLLSFLGWFLKDGVLSYNIPSAQNERAPYIYTIANIASITSYLDAAKKHIADLVARDPDWAKYILNDLLQNESLDSEGSVNYVQHYTVMKNPDGPHLRAPDTPFGDWKAQPEATISDRQAIYSGIKTNSIDYYDSQVSVNISEAVRNSLLDANMLQLPGVTSAINHLAKTTEWTIELANQQVSYWEAIDPGAMDGQDWAFEDGGTYYATKDLAKRAYEQANGVTCSLDLDNMTCTDTGNAIVFEGALIGRAKVIAPDDGADLGAMDGQDWAFEDGGSYYATKDLAKRAYEQANGVTCSLDLDSMTCIDAENAVVFEGALIGRMKTAELDPPVQKFIAFAVIAEQIFIHAENAENAAEDYLKAVALTAFDPVPEKQLILVDSFIGFFEENKVLRDSDLPPVPVAIDQLYEFMVLKEDNPNFRGEEAVTSVPVETDKLTNMLLKVRSEAVANNDTSILQQLENAVVSAYRRDKVWTTTNYLYAQHFIEVPFADVVDQIFINFQTGSAAYKASARIFLNQVIESIFLPNANDQLIKVSELTAQFEAAKVFKSLVE